MQLTKIAVEASQDKLMGIVKYLPLVAPGHENSVHAYAPFITITSMPDLFEVVARLNAPRFQSGGRLAVEEFHTAEVLCVICPVSHRAPKQKNCSCTGQAKCPSDIGFQHASPYLLELATVLLANPQSCSIVLEKRP